MTVRLIDTDLLRHYYHPGTRIAVQLDPGHLDNGTVAADLVSLLFDRHVAATSEDTEFLENVFLDPSWLTADTNHDVVLRPTGLYDWQLFRDAVRGRVSSIDLRNPEALLVQGDPIRFEFPSGFDEVRPGVVALVELYHRNQTEIGDLEPFRDALDDGRWGSFRSSWLMAGRDTNRELLQQVYDHCQAFLH